MKRWFVFVIISLLLHSCFYKSVMEGEADDVVKAAVFQHGGNSYLVMLELVFQATSKESGRGLTVVSGFNEQRISVYDLQNGQLLVRKKAGRQTKQPLSFLGITRGNLWLYSPEEGIHSLDPFTLEPRISQDSIFSINPELEGNLATCEFYQIPVYFHFNDLTQQAVLTDNKGFRYFLDTDDLKANKVTGEYKPFDSQSNKYLVASVFFPKPQLVLSGDLRKSIRGEKEILHPDLSFLDGQFIVDRNPGRIMEGMENQNSIFQKELIELNLKINRLTMLNGGSGPPWRTPQRDTLRRLENQKYQMEADLRKLEDCRKDYQEDGLCHGYQQLLTPDTTSFFIFHRSGTAREAHAVISRMHIRNQQELTERWNTEIPGLFFDPASARETSVFKEVFSKGNPEFGFSCFDLAGNKLIMVWMLHVVCIDTDTGKLLWKFRI